MTNLRSALCDMKVELILSICDRFYSCVLFVDTTYMWKMNQSSDHNRCWSLLSGVKAGRFWELQPCRDSAACWVFYAEKSIIVFMAQRTQYGFQHRNSAIKSKLRHWKCIPAVAVCSYGRLRLDGAAVNVNLVFKLFLWEQKVCNFLSI